MCSYRNAGDADTWTLVTTRSQCTPANLVIQVLGFELLFQFYQYFIVWAVKFLCMSLTLRSKCAFSSFSNQTMPHLSLFPSLCKSCLLLSAQTAVYLPRWVDTSRAVCCTVVLLSKASHFPALSAHCMFALRVVAVCVVFSMCQQWGCTWRVNSFLMPSAGGILKLHEQAFMCCMRNMRVS